MSFFILLNGFEVQLLFLFSLFFIVLIALYLGFNFLSDMIIKDYEKMKRKRGLK
jgi:hypothetical protein